MPRLRRWLRIWLGIEAMEQVMRELVRELHQSSPYDEPEAEAENQAASGAAASRRGGVRQWRPEAQPAAWVCSDAEAARQERAMMRRRFPLGDEGNHGRG